LGFDIPQVVEYFFKIPPTYGLDGKTVLFVSDLHYSDGKVDPGIFKRIIEKLSPDWIVFGGDIVSYACFIDEVFLWLKNAFADFKDIPKIAVFGNWDRRRRWFPNRVWFEKYKESGFTLLVNEELIIDRVRFYGIDEPRTGNPVLDPGKFDSTCLNCFVSHSIEPVIDTVTQSGISGNNLVLCGHSHGGQIRIPLFGAVLTSTPYWKLFEYGHYAHKKSNIDMIVTSGMGMSRFPVRLFCHPEVVIIRFKEC